MSMWKEALLLMGLLLMVEIGYRVVDYLIYKANNIPGDMEEE